MLLGSQRCSDDSRTSPTKLQRAAVTTRRNADYLLGPANQTTSEAFVCTIRSTPTSSSSSRSGAPLAGFSSELGALKRRAADENKRLVLPLPATSGGDPTSHRHVSARASSFGQEPTARSSDSDGK